MLLLIVFAATVAVFWFASKEKPLYTKTYFQTRSSGVFKTDYAMGFREYIEALDKEVRMRFTIGPFSPTDDLLADLYHPELESNWRRDLCRIRVYEWLRDALKMILVLCVCIAVADFALRLLTHRRGVLICFAAGASMEQLIAWAFAAAVCTYILRNRRSINRTQGYLDGYSDRCAGLERSMCVIAPPSPRNG